MLKKKLKKKSKQFLIKLKKIKKIKKLKLLKKIKKLKRLKKKLLPLLKFKKIIAGKKLFYRKKKKPTVLVKVLLKSYRVLDLNMTLFIIRNLLEKRRLCFSFVRLPLKTRLITLNRSPHVHKKSKVQFHLKTHTCFFEIRFSNKYFNVTDFLKLVQQNISRSVSLKLSVKER